MKSTFKNISSEKQELVIDAAFIEFGKYGYVNASTNRLVKTLGISKGSLFKYFDGKLDLYLYLLERCVKNLVEYMQSFTPSSKGKIDENLLAYAAYEFDYLANNTSEYLFFFQFTKEMNHPDLVEYRDKLNSESYLIAQTLFDDLQMGSDLGLRKHLMFILASYNRSFMDGLPENYEWKSLKYTYLEGLKNHLKYIDWSG